MFLVYKYSYTTIAEKRKSSGTWPADAEGGWWFLLVTDVVWMLWLRNKDNS